MRSPYGKKGGTSATANEVISTYEVTLPDGLVLRKRTYETQVEEAVAMVFRGMNGRFYVTGIYDKAQDFDSRYLACPAKKVANTVSKLDRQYLAEDLSNPIVAAVRPAREDAIAWAEKMARACVERVRDALAKVENDLDKVAPYPKSTLPKAEYIQQVERRHLFDSLVKWRSSGYRKPGDPCLVDIDPARVERFVENEKRGVGLQYDSYIYKLVTKIGEVTSAKLEGNHVWAESFLTVTKPSTEVETWKTQQIANQSVYGRWFPQWPTRKLKHARLGSAPKALGGSA